MQKMTDETIATPEAVDPYAHYRDRYQKLCAQRDATNESVAPMIAAKDAANDRAQVAQNEANALAAQIQEVRGGAAWIALKKEIGILAKTLSGKL